MSGLQRLLHWAVTNGAVIDPALEFRFSGDAGVHAVAASDVDVSSEPQLKIPEKLIIHGGLAQKVFGDVSDPAMGANGTLKLLLAKLKYDGSTELNGTDLNKFFEPYVDLLPLGRSTNSPFYWYEDESALFSNANLGGSLGGKLESVLDEWFVTVRALPQQFRTPEWQADLDLHTHISSITHDGLIDLVLSSQSWTSFGAYLWSSIMFTSRSFPHKIIDQSAKDGQAMLLPLIDLLNHDNSTRVNWEYKSVDNTGYFSIHSQEQLIKGYEVYNNYGAKGNEELLMGYGFVIPDNPNDSVALRLPATLQQLDKAQRCDVYLPTIDDYTFHAFDNKGFKPPSSIVDFEQQGLLYFLNKQSLIPDMLLEFFTSVHLNQLEGDKLTTRAKLQALQSLRAALEVKAKRLKKEPHSNCNNLRLLETAKIYINGQREILKLAIVEIKTQEKQLLQEWKSQVWNVKKIYKKDQDFRQVLSLLGFDTVEQAEKSGECELFLSLWILINSLDPQDDSVAPGWVTQAFASVNSDIASYKQVTPGAAIMRDLRTALDGHKSLEFLTPINLSVATITVSLLGYTRYNSDEIILVGPA